MPHLCRAATGPDRGHHEPELEEEPRPQRSGRGAAAHRGRPRHRPRDARRRRDPPAIEDFIARDVRYWYPTAAIGALHWLVTSRAPLSARAASHAAHVPQRRTIDFVAKKVGIRGEADEILARLVRAEADGREIAVEEVPRSS